MDIDFEDSDLEECANDPKFCKKNLGSAQGKKYLRRLDDLSATKTLEDTRNLPGKYHELKEDRKGQWACHLNGQYRLVFKPQSNPIPTNEHGQYIWSEINAITIIEIVDYH